MSEYKIGFIGTGNMGSAIARAVRKVLPGHEIILSNRTAAKAQALADELNCRCADNKTVARDAQYIFLGVKPQFMKEMLEGIKDILAERRDRFILVSMAAGVKIETVCEMAGGEYPVIRIMPNTPVSIGEGVVPFAVSDGVFMDEITDFCNYMRCAGTVDRLEERLIDAACAVSGCGPAFVYMFADALALAAAECGLPREKAYEYALKTVIGAATLAADSDMHLSELRDAVCSPGGATIAGVHSLESAAFKGAVMDAIKTAFDKTKQLG